MIAILFLRGQERSWDRQEESVGETGIFPKVLWEQTGSERGQPSLPFTSPHPVTALKLCREEHMHKCRNEVTGDFYPAPSKDIPKVPIRKNDDHHPSVENPVKTEPGHMAVVEA